MRFRLSCSLMLGLALIVWSRAVESQSSLPRVQPSDLVYQGTIGLPSGTILDALAVNAPLAYYAAHNSLFIGAPNNTVLELSIPAAGQVASVLQPAVDPVEGRILEASANGQLGNGLFLNGLVVEGDTLYGT